MAQVGRIAAIWRYPVKSMQGEPLERCHVDALGIPGDRGWALRDEGAGEIRGAKRFPILMQCRAGYRKEPEGETLPPVDIELPTGAFTASDAADVNDRLSELLGKPVTLWPRRPSTDRDHYRRTEKISEASLRAVFGRLPDEPLPDFSAMPPELLQEIATYTSPRGTYFDAYPIHFVTTSWLGALAEHAPASRFEAPRFRPNFVIESDAPGRVELAWCGRVLHIGTVELACTIPTVRCSMTAQKTAGLPGDPQVLRTVVRASDQKVGAYATVRGSGSIEVGDPVEVA